MGPTIDSRAPSPLPPLAHEISRPSSASTQATHPLHLQTGQPNYTTGVSLPGLSALASAAGAPSPPHVRPFTGAATGINFQASPTPTSVGGQGTNPPVCQNCSTSTTPLWRRDEIGSVLCNACGLFLKLHGRPRPISLKTDVIKSRNRVKSSGHGQKKKAPFLGNGPSSIRSDEGSPPPGYRRVSQKSAGASDRSNSPISRAHTPGMHHSGIASSHMFDAAPLADPTFAHIRHSPSLPSLHFRHPSPGSVASYGDKHLEPPQTYEHLQQQNTSLKTKVSELEVINGLYKDRIGELEHNDRLHRQAHEDARVREDNLRRRLENLEREMMEMHKGSSPSSLKRTFKEEATHPIPSNSPYHKRSRLSDPSEYPEPPQRSA